MTLLTKGLLKRLRSDAYKLFDAQAVVLRTQRQSDGAGGFVNSWQTVDACPCKVCIVDKKLALNNNLGNSDMQLVNIRLPYNVDLLRSDRIMAGNKLYDVTQVVEQSPLVMKSALCVDITGTGV